MRADAERTRDEQERDQARADRLKFREAVRVSSTGRPTGQPPRKQNDKVAQKVCERKLLARQQIGVLSRSTSFTGAACQVSKSMGLTRYQSWARGRMREEAKACVPKSTRRSTPLEKDE